MMLVLAFIYNVCMSIKSLVLEKELRLKEVLRAVGIPNGALWAARFTENLALLTLPCALLSVMVKVSGEGSPQANTKHSRCNEDAGQPVCAIWRPLVVRIQTARDEGCIQNYFSPFDANAS